MCIIAAKFKGLELPNYNRLYSMFECNADGAGFMFKDDNNKIVIKKGLMTFTDFIDTLYSYNDKYDLVNRDLIMHFRWATHGGYTQGLTHPFAVSDNFNDMKKTDIEVDLAVCHNGVYNIKTEKGVSDSMVFIKNNIYPIYKEDNNFYKENEKLLKLFRLGNKLAFLTKDGIKLVGDGFIKDEYDGIYYSNETYSYYDDFDFEDFEDLYYDNYNYGMIEDTEEEEVQTNNKEEEDFEWFYEDNDIKFCGFGDLYEI